jgi:AbrB family looped-hinge helix DNA binding protein
MPDTTLVKVSSKGLITLPKKIRSELSIEEGDYLSISSDKDTIIFRKARIEIDYENSDDAWKEHTKRRLMPLYPRTR